MLTGARSRSRRSTGSRCSARPGMPVWKEVESIDPAHHVLHLALPAPGSNEQLHELIADLHAPMLERHRPGWKVYVIDGPRRATASRSTTRCHHALVDGESGMAILRQSLAESPRDRRIRATRRPRCTRAGPRPAPHGLRATLEREARRLARQDAVGRAVARCSLLERGARGPARLLARRRRGRSRPRRR